MRGADILSERLSELGLQHEPWGDNRITVLCQAKTGEDVMIVVNEPKRFGPYFLTELYGVAAFLDGVSVLPNAIGAHLLSLNNEIPYGHWALTTTNDNRISVNFVIKLLTPEDPYSPDVDLLGMATSGIAKNISEAKRLFVK